MERLVFEAAQEGNVTFLSKLLQEDPLILDRLLSNCFFETPLHVAAMLGHVDFVKKIVTQKHELTKELNLNNSSPLHLASVRGFVDVVRALTSVDPEMCVARDKDGRNPLHLAAMKGRVDVLKALLQAKPDAARATVHRGETILHVCVMHNQFEVLKLLVEIINDKDFLNAKDDDGNTILHLAVADKQVETINYLLLNNDIDVNTVNLYGLTSMDILIQSRRDVKDVDIREFLSRAGAVSAKDSSQRHTESARTGKKKKKKKKNSEQHQDWLGKRREALMIVASLIATMAFQAGVNPPGGVWQKTEEVVSLNKTVLAGHSVLKDMDHDLYDGFLACNTVSLITSLSIILLLISGLPMRRRVFMWIQMVIMWIAITMVTLTYVLSISAIAITDWLKADKVIDVLGIVIILWLGFLGLVVLGHLIRIITRAIKALKRPEINSGIASTSDDVQVQIR